MGLLGGVCIHLVIGTVYILGNISVYLVSYLRCHGESTTLQDAIILLPLSFTGTTLSLYLGANLTKKIGPRYTTLIGNMIVTTVTFLASFFKTFWLFCVVYAFGFGLGGGISYTAPLIMGWSYFPQHKGRISGGFLTFFALGTSIFSLISTTIINPDNKKADIKEKEGHVTDKYYSADIADGFPAMMRWLALCYLCISALGVLLIMPLNQDTAGYKAPDDYIRLPSVKQGVKNPKFGLMFVMCLLSSSTALHRLWTLPGFRVQKLRQSSDQ